MLEYTNPELILDTASLEPGRVHWRSPSNLAIVKYWGKHGLQLPRNPSISLTLQNAFTETVLEYKAKESGEQKVSLELYFEEERNEAFEKKVRTYLEGITPIFPFLNQLDLVIRTANSFPHSTGIASSASAMSALALCLCSLEDTLFETLGDDDQLFDQKASYLARIGSGSACRSIFPQIALWGKTGEVEHSSDLHAVSLAEQTHEVFKTFHDDILIVDSREKSVSSRAGHALMDDNPFAEPRYKQAQQRTHFLLEALRKGDVETFGKIAEDEALTLHALMMCSNPSYLLVRPTTIDLIERVRAYRKETGNPLYFSLDAGPNLHLLYPESVVHEVRPFVEEHLVPLCEQQRWLPDWVGEGPEEL